MDAKNGGFYETLEEIPIYNFHKCFNGDLRYIYFNRKGEITKEVLEVWDLMVTENQKLTSNNSILSYYSLLSEIKFLEFRLIYAPVLINLSLKTPIKDRVKIYEELNNSWKLKIKTEKDIEKALKILNNSKNKLKRKLTEKKDIEEKNKEIKEKSLSLQSQAVKIERNLGVKPNIFKDSVVTWYSYFKEIETLSNKKNV